jgi:hypothetical protein
VSDRIYFNFSDILLEQSAKTLPIAPKKKQEIQKQLAESSAVIDEASSEVEELVEP